MPTQRDHGKGRFPTSLEDFSLMYSDERKVELQSFFGPWEGGARKLKMWVRKREAILPNPLGGGSSLLSFADGGKKKKDFF